MSEGFLEALLYSDDNLVPTSLPPSFPQGPGGHHVPSAGPH